MNFSSYSPKLDQVLMKVQSSTEAVNSMQVPSRNYKHPVQGHPLIWFARQGVSSQVLVRG